MFPWDLYFAYFFQYFRFVFIFGEKGSYVPGCLKLTKVVEAGLELLTLLYKHWNYRCSLPCPAYTVLGNQTLGFLCVKLMLF